MATTVAGVTSKAEMVEIEPKTGMALGSEKEEKRGSAAEAKIPGEEMEKGEETRCENDIKATVVKEEVKVVVEPKTGVSFPVKLNERKLLLGAVGVRKKSMLGVGIKIYGFGIYADNEKFRDVLKSKFEKAPAKPTKEMYEAVIDSDAEMVLRLVIVFSYLTMNMVRRNFDESLGASIKKLTAAKTDELTKRIMGEASDEIKLTAGSVIEISRLPGYTLETKVMGVVASKVESELLCRAFVNLYLGDDPFDKEAKEKFGMSLLSLF